MKLDSWQISSQKHLDLIFMRDVVESIHIFAIWADPRSAVELLQNEGT